ncbi:MAG: NAD(P)/FAD-dependent oxidoreductase [Clostridia bacterium]|nr:NAD(P)/FAD-dependent oxidoreductase [Clostridia bacterium]
MKVIIIGGGPAGMIAAMKSAMENNDVIILEKMNTCGRKLLITGKGRCNITSSLDIDEFIKYIPGNGKFLYSAFQNFNNKDIIDILEKQNVKVKIERGNRVFPVSDKSQDVLDALINLLKSLNVKIRTNCPVEKILVDNNKVIGVLTGDKERIEADKVILATGGKSYPLTGSTGDGYKMAKELGHTITKIRPSLVPLKIFEVDTCQDLQGLSLKNVKIHLKANEKMIYEDFGEMIFTHFGVSGPVILSASAIMVRNKEIDNLLKNKKIKLQIDFKPALSVEKLDLRIRRDFEELKNKQFKNSLNDLLPQKLIPVIIKQSGINENKQVNEITREERIRLGKLLKEFTLTVKDFKEIEDAIVTAGGVSIKEINPKTMESKIIDELYFAGEVIDVDGYTGGFNLQTAYSTGYTAGMN